MGIISDIKASKEFQKIKNGGTGNLSISQITGLITNMMDAKKNLNSTDFKEVYNLFNELRSCNTKMKMNMKQLDEVCVDIIKKFDKIAPYIKYSGGNEYEISFLMDDINNVQNETSLIDDFELSKQDLETAQIIVDQSMGIINIDIAKDFMQVLYCYMTFGKNKALDIFDDLASKLIKTESIMSLAKIGFLVGVLNSQGIIDENEMNNLNNKYQSIVMSNIA